ncbi:MAG: hypothetical protein JF623_01020 [Acidobacteria bacterium]|nr:hypothetical protein [Acidobacteriota bacterium]
MQRSVPLIAADASIQGERRSDASAVAPSEAASAMSNPAQTVRQFPVS